MPKESEQELYGDPRGIIPKPMIQTRLDAMGMTKKQLAEALGLKSPKPVGQWIRGEAYMRDCHLVAAACVLECSIPYLLGYMSEPSWPHEPQGPDEVQNELACVLSARQVLAAARAGENPKDIAIEPVYAGGFIEKLVRSSHSGEDFIMRLDNMRPHTDFRDIRHTVKAAVGFALDNGGNRSVGYALVLAEDMARAAIEYPPRARRRGQTLMAR